MNIVSMPISSLKSPSWRANYILRPDVRLLTDSLIEYGWLQPIIARPDGTVIDGNYRLQIADSKKVRKVLGEYVPVQIVDVDEIEAMAMHLRVNRSRGVPHAKQISRLVQKLVRSGSWDDGELKVLLRMSSDEFELLMDGTLFKKRNIADYSYSPAWIPVEAPAGATSVIPVIERPPNADK
jgi:ParB-like chromosome segregation protein Spo0J